MGWRCPVARLILKFSQSMKRATSSPGRSGLFMLSRWARRLPQPLKCGYGAVGRPVCRTPLQSYAYQYNTAAGKMLSARAVIRGQLQWLFHPDVSAGAGSHRRCWLAAWPFRNAHGFPPARERRGHGRPCGVSRPPFLTFGGLWGMVLLAGVFRYAIWGDDCYGGTTSEAGRQGRHCDRGRFQRAGHWKRPGDGYLVRPGGGQGAAGGLRRWNGRRRLW